jgi:hypothetical protein
MDDQQDRDGLDQAPDEVPEDLAQEGEVQESEIQETEFQEQAESPLKRNWPMIVIGVAMLVVGLVLGYIGRGFYGPEASAAKATQAAVAVAVQTRASANKEVMTMLIGATRHFKGDANAPVTIIEFSDFQ